MASVDWISFITASIAVILTPGPGSLYVAQSAATCGLRSGVAAILGLVLGDICLIICSFAGASALLLAHPLLFHGGQILGAAYLIYLGIHALRAIPVKPSARESHEVARISLGRAYLLTLLNPEVLIFFMAFFPLFIKPVASNLSLEYAIMAAIFTVLSISYLSVLVSVVIKMGRNLTDNGKAIVILNRICGGIFIILGVKVAGNALF